MSNKKILLSVIIPTYLEESYIKNCLEGIKNQDFDQSGIEIIVVDSNSPDDTRKIAEKYAKVINIKEKGVGKARNVGAKYTKGELLAFVDADTILHPKFLSEMYKTFLNPNTVYATGFVLGLENYGFTKNLYKFIHYGMLNIISTLSSIFGLPLFPTVCSVCRKSAFIQVNGFDEQLAVGEDLDFSLRIRKYGKCTVNRKSIAFTSLRRLEKKGILKCMSMYLGNYLKIFLFKRKSWVDKFPQIR